MANENAHVALKTEELSTLFAYYKENINNEFIQIDVMFGKKPLNKNGKYKCWMLICKDIDLSEMIIATLDNLITISSERTIDKYDLELSTDETIQVVETEKVVNFPQIVDNLTIEYTDENIVNESTDYDKFDFVVMKLSDNNESEPKSSIIILKKHYKSPAKFKGTQSYIFNGKQANPFNKKLLIIGSNVDAVSIDNNFYIMNREHFNTMLNFKDVYYKIVDDKSPEIHSSELFDNSLQFIEDCKNNGRYVTRLTKAILADGFKNVKNNKDKIPQLIHDHNLRLEMNTDGKIIYKKENVDEMLNLLLEHYVTSDLTERRMLAKAIEKYE